MNNQQLDFTVNANNLYREESITDFKVASIRSLTPVKSDGTKDDGRETLFIGHTQLMSPQGMVPLQAMLQASTLEEAIEKYPSAMKKALEEMVEDARKMQQEQNRKRQEDDSRIIVPGR